MEATNASDLKNASALKKKSNLKEAKRQKQYGAVLHSLANGLSVTEVCANAGIARQTYYDWLTADPEFARRVEQTADVRASFIESVLWHAACRAIGEPKYIRAASAYLQHHERKLKRQEEQRRWEAEQQRWEAEQKRREEATLKASSKPQRPRTLRRRHTPPLPPKWVRLLVTGIAPATALTVNPAPLLAAQSTGDGSSLPPPVPPS